MLQFNIGMPGRSPFVIQADKYDTFIDRNGNRTLYLTRNEEKIGVFHGYDFFTVVQVEQEQKEIAKDAS